MDPNQLQAESLCTNTCTDTHIHTKLANTVCSDQLSGKVVLHTKQRCAIWELVVESGQWLQVGKQEGKPFMENIFGPFLPIHFPLFPRGVAHYMALCKSNGGGMGRRRTIPYPQACCTHPTGVSE